MELPPFLVSEESDCGLGLVLREIVHVLQKYVLNSPIKGLFAMGIVPPGYARLETIGW
jgi:hypothetical protein